MLRTLEIISVSSFLSGGSSKVCLLPTNLSPSLALLCKTAACRLSAMSRDPFDLSTTEIYLFLKLTKHCFCFLSEFVAVEYSFCILRSIEVLHCARLGTSDPRPGSAAVFVTVMRCRRHCRRSTCSNPSPVARFVQHLSPDAH